MKEEAVSESAVRQFLLGNVDDDERRRIESLFISDSIARERILAAEQDLIDDYLDGSLTPADKQRFIEQYTADPAQRRKLRIATSIKEWATREGNATPALEPVRASLWSRLGNLLTLKPQVAISVAVTAMVVVIGLAVWLNSTVEQRNKQLTIQEEVVKLNVPSKLREMPPNLSSLELRPGVLRGAEQKNELVIGPDTQIGELRLLWIQKDRFPKYKAVVRRVGGRGHESMTIDDLQPEDDGKVVRLRLPNRFLTRGAYQLELSGIPANGGAGSSDEYSFTVRN